MKIVKNKIEILIVEVILILSLFIQNSNSTFHSADLIKSTEGSIAFNHDQALNGNKLALFAFLDDSNKFLQVYIKEKTAQTCIYGLIIDTRTPTDSEVELKCENDIISVNLSQYGASNFYVSYVTKGAGAADRNCKGFVVNIPLAIQNEATFPVGYANQCDQIKTFYSNKVNRVIYAAGIKTGGKYDIKYGHIEGATVTEIGIINDKTNGDSEWPSLAIVNNEIIVVFQGMGLNDPVPVGEIPLHMQIIENISTTPAKKGTNKEVDGTVNSSLQHSKPIIREHNNVASPNRGYTIMWSEQNQKKIWMASYNKDHAQQCIQLIGDGFLSDFIIYGTTVYIIGVKADNINLANAQAPFGLQYNIDCTQERDVYSLSDNINQFHQSGAISLSVSTKIDTILTGFIKQADKKVINNEYFLNQKTVCTAPNQDCVGCVGSLTCPLCKGSTPELRAVRKVSDGVCTCQNQYFNEAGKDDCQKCDHQCEKCTEKGKCTQCKNNGMFEPECLYQMEGNYQYIKPDGSIAYAQCAPKCQSCKDSYENCQQCAGFNRETGGKCNCLQGFYDYNGQLRDCLKCAPECAECDEGYKCTKCVEAAHRVLNEFTGKCVCEKGYINNPDKSQNNCIKGYQISDSYIDKCPENTFQNENTQVCEYIEYELVSNMVLIIILGVFIAIIQVALCCVVHLLIQKKYQSYSEQFFSEQMKLKQQRQFIYRGLKTYDDFNQSIKLDQTTQQRGVHSGIGSKKDHDSSMYEEQANQKRKRRQQLNSIAQSQNSILQSENDNQVSNINLINNENHPEIIASEMNRSQVYDNERPPATTIKREDEELIEIE